MRRIYLTSPEIRDAIQSLEGIEIPKRTLGYWAESGLAPPSADWPRRKGRYHPRLYSLPDLKRIRLIVRLTEKGISTQRVRRILAYLDKHYPDVLRVRSHRELVIAGNSVSVRGADEPDVLVPDGQTAFRFDLAEIADADDVREAAVAALG